MINITLAASMYCKYLLRSKKKYYYQHKLKQNISYIKMSNFSRCKRIAKTPFQESL